MRAPSAKHLASRQGLTSGPTPASAPAGGGGPGSFDSRAPNRGVADAASPGRSTLPSPLYVSALGSGPATKKPSPPPRTKPTKKRVETQDKDVVLHVQVLPDVRGKTGGKWAKTNIKFPGTSFPGYKGVRKGGEDVITELTGKFAFRGPITIQTLYGVGAKSAEASLYGRGTTEHDKASGNTTLGFHESCHREDYLKYLDDHPVPCPSLAVGMTVEEFTAAKDAFQAEYDAYREAVEADSVQRTDEVGYPRSQCETDGKCV